MDGKTSLVVKCNLYGWPDCSSVVTCNLESERWVFLIMDGQNVAE